LKTPFSILRTSNETRRPAGRPSSLSYSCECHFESRSIINAVQLISLLSTLLKSSELHSLHFISNLYTSHNNRLDRFPAAYTADNNVQLGAREISFYLGKLVNLKFLFTIHQYNVIYIIYILYMSPTSIRSALPPYLLENIPLLTPFIQTVPSNSYT